MGTLLFFSIGLYWLYSINSKTQDYSSKQISARAKALYDFVNRE